MASSGLFRSAVTNQSTFSPSPFAVSLSLLSFQYS